jgi:AraC family transcriptional regulator of adaptative response / DNA-3-methyladenine glycosylase II
MMLDDQICYRALAARDGRFDGLFFVGARTTGIYCRPVCTARTPGRERCRFFSNAAAAEREGFRPCLRCRPELAPGHAPVDAVGRLAHKAATRIESGGLNDGGGLEDLAAELQISSRQLRRAIRQEYGVSPVELAQTNRLLFAKKLLTESALPMIDVALASGFSSVRRFNSLFRERYGLAPTHLRRRVESIGTRETLRLTLVYRPPFAWPEMLRFLAGRATAGVECVTGDSYLRTVEVGRCWGWLRAEPIVGRAALAVELSTSLVPVLAPVLARLRHLFDLAARPDVIESHLAEDKHLAACIRGTPGMRVPGAFDGFELALRAILGQRISVVAATTLAGRLARAYGEPIETPFPCLNLTSPTAGRLAHAEPARLTRLGIARPRARCIVDLARAVVDREIFLDPVANLESAVGRLQEISGIGDWTANYIAMRALRCSDAFPAGDLGLLRGYGTASAAVLRQAAEAWRPWRAYAAMHLWNCQRRHLAPRDEQCGQLECNTSESRKLLPEGLR